MVNGEGYCSLTATRLNLENSSQDLVCSGSVVVLETGPRRSEDLEIWFRSGGSWQLGVGANETEDYPAVALPAEAYFQPYKSTAQV